MPIYQFKNSSDANPVNILFYHVPKNAGITIDQFFKANNFKPFFENESFLPIRELLKVTTSHFDASIYSTFLKADRIYSFAMTRNPVDRFISEYRWSIEKSNISTQVAKRSFDKFVEIKLEIVRKDPSHSGNHFMPQSDFIPKNVTKTFKLEDGLNVALKTVLNDNGFTLNEQINLPKLNSSKIKKPAISSYTRQLIQDFYKDDYVRFNY